MLSTVQETLQILLPDASEIREEVKVLREEQRQEIEEKIRVKLDPELDKEFTFFIGSANGKIVGYVIEDAVRGKWGPIHYLLSLDPSGKVKDVIVLEYKEKRGKPVAKRRFLKQFIGKTIRDRIKLKKDIQGVSGATISSRVLTNGIRKSVYIFTEIYAQKHF